MFSWGFESPSRPEYSPGRLGAPWGVQSTERRPLAADRSAPGGRGREGRPCSVSGSTEYGSTFSRGRGRGFRACGGKRREGGGRLRSWRSAHPRWRAFLTALFPAERFGDQRDHPESPFPPWGEYRIDSAGLLCHDGFHVRGPPDTTPKSRIVGCPRLRRTP